MPCDKLKHDVLERCARHLQAILEGLSGSRSPPHLLPPLYNDSEALLLTRSEFSQGDVHVETSQQRSQGRAKSARVHRNERLGGESKALGFSGQEGGLV